MLPWIFLRQGRKAFGVGELKKSAAESKKRKPRSQRYIAFRDLSN